ncbi:MAG: ABC transporter ATP-binding protein [Leptolyngbyaceae bacterium]|nr:ABC transporter ATP-binding protein [Leptolyngbyaceae bacterium]
MDLRINRTEDFSAIATTDPAIDVNLSGLVKVFGDDTAAIQGIDLSIYQGEFFSVLGPSGCGKTTLLRLIAGFEQPTAGRIMICGRVMTHVPAYRRPTNTVFQSYALFNHMTVWDNIAFGLRIQKLSQSEIRHRVQDALQLVKMESFAARYPSQLSGGQQQRVALARALVNRPAVVLLDEPLAALDLKLRKEMQVELATLHQELGITFVLVTHDQEEALSLSDRIAVMREGRIEQVGTPKAIYNSPKTPFVADFIGDTNLFNGTVISAQSEPASLAIETCRGLRLVVNAGVQSLGQSLSPSLGQASPVPTSSADEADVRVQNIYSPGKEVIVSIRPENIYLSSTRPHQQVNCFEGKLHTVMYMGTHIQCVVVLTSGDRLKVMQPNDSDLLLTPKSWVYVYWQSRDSLALVNRS